MGVGRVGENRRLVFRALTKHFPLCISTFLLYKVGHQTLSFTPERLLHWPCRHGGDTGRLAGSVLFTEEGMSGKKGGPSVSRGSQEAVDTVSWEGDLNSSPHSENFPVLNFLCLWFMSKLRISVSEILLHLSPMILRICNFNPDIAPHFPTQHI